MTDVRSVTTAGLSGAERAALRRLFESAWPNGDFSDEDWDHAMGGQHWLVDVDGLIVSHASVVARTLWVAERPLQTGYLEAVATDPAWQRQGLGTAVVRDATAFIVAGFELGALSTGGPAFYEGLGWRRWRGPTYVRAASGLLRTEEEDGGILVLPTPTTPDLDLTSALTCDWRAGDAW